jgi:hypothetical protein
MPTRSRSVQPIETKPSRVYGVVIRAVDRAAGAGVRRAVRQEHALS